MKRSQYLMGIDNGGSNTKCAVFDLQGNEIAAASATVPVNQPAPGFVERDPEQVWRSNCAVIRQALRSSGLRPDQIAAVSLCGYGGGICLLDERGRCVRPIIVSTDTRASTPASLLNASPNAAQIFSITHQRPWAGQPAALLNWFSAQSPCTLDAARYALPIKDYIRSRLTQEYALELTDASNNGLIDPAASGLSGKLLQLYGLEQLHRLFDLPLLSPTATAGRVTPQASEETGLEPGTLVAAGSYDVSACTVGCGALDSDCLALTNGTWIMASYLDTTFSHAAPSTLVTVSPLPGYYLLEQGSATGTANLNWYLDRFLSKIYPRCSKDQLYELCAQIASSIPPQDGVIFVPNLYVSTGDSTPQGAFLGLAGHNDELDLLYAVMEGIILSVQRHIRLLEQGRRHWRELRMSGGVSASRPWSQMLCDLLQMPISIMAGSQQGARGAAMYAGVAAGIFLDLHQAAQAMTRPSALLTPQRQYADIYQYRSERYQQALDALEQFHRSS